MQKELHLHCWNVTFRAAVSSRVDKWGRAVGCKEVTVYAFSSENFKRTKEEVDDLMELMCWKAETILQDV